MTADKAYSYNHAQYTEITALPKPDVIGQAKKRRHARMHTHTHTYTQGKKKLRQTEIRAWS